MKHLALLPLMLSLIAAPSANALSARTISTEQAQGTTGSIITLEVAPGYGLNINLIPTGEVVKKAWIDDPSRIVLSFDGNLCQSSGESECNNEGATVIHLRQIKAIAFPDLPRSPGGGTLLTLITEGGSAGRKIYQFKVVPVSGQPKYTVLSISPDVEPISPVLPPVRRNLPIVQAPVQSAASSGDGQWQAPSPPTSVRQLNGNSNTVKLPSTVDATTLPVATQQVSPEPNSNAVTTNSVISATPKTAPTPKPSLSSTTEGSKQNEIAQARPVTGFAPSQHLNSDGFSSLSTSQEHKPTTANSTPSNKLTNNSRTPSNGTNVNNKIPKRATPSSTLTNNALPAVRPRAIVKPVVSSTAEGRKSNGSIEQANALVRGLVVARQKGQINHGTTTWKKVQSVVRLMRRGNSKQEAAQKVKVSLELIERLLVWGSGSTVAAASN